MGKKATVVSSDSDIPKGFKHFPGVDQILRESFFDLDLKKYDLFIIQDSGSANMISKFQPITFPLPIRTIVIDHHASNPSYGDINLVEPSCPATAQVLFELFSLWNVEITPEIASNLFIGIHSDTGGFKYPGTTGRTFEIAGRLAQIAPNFPKMISSMENSNTPDFLKFQALALASIETSLNGKMGLSVIPFSSLKERNIPFEEVRGDAVSPFLRSVAEWVVSGVLIEIEPNKVKASFRSKDGDVYNVSKLAVALGGGGHKAASGASLDMSIGDAKKLVVAKAKELYNL
jgi:bifunctional oligoribonuclease and PAP phosphatase NrnA